MMTQLTDERSMRLAHGRLRFTVIACCWLVCLALATQMVVWSLATYTDMRYPAAVTPTEAPLVVHTPQAKPAAAIFSPADLDRRGRAVEANPPATFATLTGAEKTMSAAVSTARTLGIVGVLVLSPLVAYGLLFGAVCGAPRVDRGVSALAWSIVLSMLVLPAGGLLGLPWQEGALVSYSQMVNEVELARRGALGQGFEMTFYARFLFLPAISVIGFILVGWRFSGAVEGMLLAKQSARLDPALEREVAGMNAGSLHGGGAGRAAGALGRAVAAAESINGHTAPASTPKTSPTPPKRPVPSATKVPAGEVPRRLI